MFRAKALGARHCLENNLRCIAKMGSVLTENSSVDCVLIQLPPCAEWQLEPSFIPRVAYF